MHLLENNYIKIVQVRKGKSKTYKNVSYITIVYKLWGKPNSLYTHTFWVSDKFGIAESASMKIENG